MGHTRLGAIPKSRKWNEVVEQVTGAGLAGGVTPDLPPEISTSLNWSSLVI
jgi:hypothetical protein